MLKGDPRARESLVDSIATMGRKSVNGSRTLDGYIGSKGCGECAGEQILPPLLVQCCVMHIPPLAWHQLPGLCGLGSLYPRRVCIPLGSALL
jgi:hypothetical protein